MIKRPAHNSTLVQAIAEECGQPEDRIRRSLDQAAAGQTIPLAEVARRLSLSELLPDGPPIPEPNQFRCARHGVYGGEFPYPEHCGYCAGEDRVRREERQRCVQTALRLARQLRRAGDAAGRDAVLQLAKLLRGGEAFRED